ncbi:hypothetical protein OGAPHI_002745 [Ogataea philodendri]|uniref:F-box domain-containing protein n=1 Tax=Ogataea philodendri TaxID=1378263 RepID=A0A9P8T8A1_9ASCO|nr:uncharacterized protein OGAPHI_002745 [Ogataea philodendri]KAH3668990.1 hypothetical protein OGAPHI_002745 [Ogataea philodendri]
MLASLPNELVLEICDGLSQADCFHLMLCSRSLYKCGLRRLYRSIIVDSSDICLEQCFEDYYGTRDLCGSKVRSTRVRTSYGTKQLVRTLSETEHCLLVERIEIKQEVELPMARCLFKMINLKCADIPNAGFLSNLDLRSLTTNRLKKFNRTTKELRLTKYSPIDLAQMPALEKLCVSGMISSSLKPIRASLSSIFHSNGTRIQLKEFGLESAIIHPEEVMSLKTNFDFSQLRVLRLADIVEYPCSSQGLALQDLCEFDLNRWISHMAQSTECVPEKSFLMQIAPDLVNLQSLDLDVSNCIYDYGAELISTISYLQTLRVKISPTHCSAQTLDKMTEKYFESIGLHKGLQHLCINTKQPVKLESVRTHLVGLNQLKSLQLCISLNDMVELADIIADLNIEYLDIRSPSCLVGQSLYENLHDIFTNKSLKYLRLKDKIYDIENGRIAGPKLDECFEHMLINA